MDLPTQVSGITERSQAWWAEAPSVQKYGALGGGIVGVALIIFMFFTMSGGKDQWEGRILYSNLEFGESADISNRLRTLEVPHRLTADATAILVPEDRYMELRVQLAGEGYPKSGRIGYEIFDEAQLAMTDFLQKVNFQRALQEV